MSKIIRTVCGDISPEKLGYTSVHEHTISSAWELKKVLLLSGPDMMKGISAYQGGADIGAEAERRKQEGITDIPQMDIKGVFDSMKMSRGNPARKLSDIEYYKRELDAFWQYGGRSICDCSPIPMGGVRLKTVQELSRKSGVQIVSGAGYYTKASFKKAWVKKGEEFMVSRVEHYLDEGDGSCDARPGFAKCAVSVVENEEICPVERMAVRACAKAAKKRGMSLHIHTAFPVRKVHILKLADMLEQEIGLEPGKVIFCHMDSYNLGMGNPVSRINRDGYDLSLPLELAKRGFHIGLDTWGGSHKNETAVRYGVNVRKKMLLELLESGYEKNVTLGHDMMNRAVGVQNNAYGYTLFPITLQEMLQNGEISAETFHRLTVENPAELLSFEA